MEQLAPLAPVKAVQELSFGNTSAISGGCDQSELKSRNLFSPEFELGRIDEVVNNTPRS